MSDHRLERAAQLLAADHPMEAEALAREVLTGDAQCVAAYAVLAEALATRGALPDAVNVAVWGLEVDPEHPQLVHTLAWTLSASSRGEEARSVALTLVERWPHSWDSHYALSAAQLAPPHPDPQAALVSATRATELGPQVAAAHNLVGVCRQRLGHPEAAGLAFQKAAEIDPTSPETQGNLARLDLQAGRLEEASSRVRSALGTHAQSPYLQGTLRAVVARATMRIFSALFLAALILGLMSVSADYPMAGRATLLPCVLVLVAVSARRFTRDVPGGLRRWAHDSLLGNGLVGAALTSLAVVTIVDLPVMALAPHGIVVVGFTVLWVGWLLVALVLATMAGLRAVASLCRPR
jgi:Tfp pilus assembly protein PilF